MSNSYQMLTGIFESMRIKEQFYQTVSAKNLHQINSMKVEPETTIEEMPKDRRSKISIPGLSESIEETMSPEIQEESKKLETILRQSLGQNLDFKA